MKHLILFTLFISACTLSNAQEKSPQEYAYEMSDYACRVYHETQLLNQEKELGSDQEIISELQSIISDMSKELDALTKQFSKVFGSDKNALKEYSELYTQLFMHCISEQYDHKYVYEEVQSPMK